MTENATLGSTTKSPSVPSGRASYKVAYSLLDEAQRLLQKDNHRVCICHKYRIPDYDAVEIRRNKDEKTASYGGLQKCGNVWSCPVCSKKISEQRRDELSRAVGVARGRGDRVVMLTLTHSHGLKDSARASREEMVKAYGRLTSGRWWQEMTDYFQIYGRIRAIETTHSNKNGWHIHFHVLLFLRGDGQDMEYLESNVRGRWSGILNRMGGFASHERGVTLTENQSDIATYITKSGESHTDIKKTESDWTESHEMAKAAVKTTKDAESRTPFALLADSKRGDKQAGALFVEFVQSMKHQRQLVWSNGLKDDLLDEEHFTDEELADMPELETVTTIDIRTYHAICRLGMRGDLLDMAANGRDHELQTFLAYMENHTWRKVDGHDNRVTIPQQRKRKESQEGDCQSNERHTGRCRASTDD